MSEPRPNSHDEQLQQQSTETKTSVAETNEQNFAQTGPRHLLPVHPPNPATGGGLSRNPSTSSNASRDSRMYEFPQRPRVSKPMEPPVTKTTLSELDVNKIIHNPKLRHDINFDPDLHFRPNVDGEKGRRKQERADQFWNLLTEQLQLFIIDRDEFMNRFGQGEEWCLPQLLKSIKEIIQTLVPQRDRMYLDEGLNVELIMQQFSKGMADLEKLATWLSGVLKSHCAPMRDEWVDDMYNQLTNGNRNNDMEELVQGMRSLLGVLEAMKLDVANHQIRCLRPILIEDTVHFEQRFFLKKIQGHKMDPAPAQAWYMAMSQCYSHDPASVQSFGEMGVFFEAMCKMVLPSTDPYTSHPDTFIFDEERMSKVRSDMLDAINLEICMRLYEELERKYRYCDAMSSISAISTPFLSTPFSDALGFLSSRMDDDGSECFNSGSSRPSSLVFSSAGSAQSSPRSSMILPAQPSVTRSEDPKAKSKALYDSLVALLQTSTSTRSVSRWKAMKDSLALQIFRFTNAPAQDLLQFEDELDSHLSELSSPLFQQVEQYYHYHLLVELRQRVKDFKGLSGATLFSVATGGRLQGPSRSWEGRENVTRERSPLENAIREAREEGGVEDMATRLAHMGLVHWRVWSHLVYVGDIDSVMPDEPTMPVAI
ncbi:hypothetical protein M426DRAFT_73199 [Hypoxylon sp. CI-4A]|nr:hypothetical protein M426DRAFT_73199 [Hypoxylon sp. CI-4A]